MSFYKYLADNNYYNLHVCHAQFDAQEEGDLNLSEGDVIIEANRVNEHWLQGQICYESQTRCWSTSREFGNFPANHCWQLDTEQVRAFCQERLNNYDLEQHLEVSSPPLISKLIPSLTPPPVGPVTLPSQSLSSESTSSRHSSSSSSVPKQHLNDFHYRPQSPPHYEYKHSSQTLPPAPPKPPQPHRQSMQQTVELAISRQDKLPSSVLSGYRHHDKLKGWLNLVKKKTARISTRITASLGLISLTRDEEFERHHETFKHIEKTVRVFIKNLATFVEHFEHFLQSLQSTSEHLSDFYRDKSHHQKELDELRKKNRALACEHFHAFKRIVDRQVIVVCNQLLQKFSGPHQLISKRSAKLLDYDNKTKEMESARGDSSEKIRDQYVIAKELYERINNQLKDELPKFNRLALNIFKECILVLLDGRRELVLSYTKQTASLLDTPLMMTYTASSILTSCEDTINIIDNGHVVGKCGDHHKNGIETSGHESRLNSANDDYLSRPQSRASKLSSEFDQMALAAREISSTPLSQVSESRDVDLSIKYDEPDAGLGTSDGVEVVEGPQGETESLDDEPVKREPPKEKRKKKKLQIYVASWPFVATGPNQLTIGCKQPLKLVKGCDECGNSDWSLVQDKKGQLGYVPSSYIKKKE